MVRGVEPKLELQIDLARVNVMSATPIEIKARLRAVHCTRQRAAELFEKMSPEIFAGLQQRLLVNSEKRTKDRLLWPHPITIIPIDPHGQQEEPIECRGKDLSQTGVGFYLPHDLTTAEVLVELPNPLAGASFEDAGNAGPRQNACADGWYKSRPVPPADRPPQHGGNLHLTACRLALRRPTRTPGICRAESRRVRQA